MKLWYSYHYKRFDANTKVYYSWSKNILMIKQDHECYFWLLLLIYCGRFDSKKRFYVHQVLLSMNIFRNMCSQVILCIIFSSDWCTAEATNTKVEQWACRLLSGPEPGCEQKTSFRPFGLEKGRDAWYMIKICNFYNEVP